MTRDEEHAGNLKFAREALSIVDNGACNPRALARWLVAAIDHHTEHGHACLKGDSGGAAVRQVLSQLSYLCGASIGDYPQWGPDQMFLASLIRADEEAKAGGVTE